MNDIIFAGKYEKFETSKYFEIILPDGAESVTVVPPLAKNCFSGNGIKVTLEKALLPFRQITEVPDGGDIRHAAERAAFYFNCGLPERQMILSALGGLITALITSFSRQSGYSPAVQTVIAEIKKGVSDCAYSAEESLRKLPLNYDYMRKLFKKEAGVTPREYLLRERMELARGIIRGGLTNKYSGYTVSQIAEACGFSDPLYFSRVFKKYFGVSPSEYR